MANIHVLDASVYNKISAGEVIEKPASVVKELVENALDAGATQIDVKVEEGGLTYIAVSDNGKGIDVEDLPAVFLPHATSKISTAEDLFGVSTLGFRGEAMASIAAAAMVSLTSRTAGASCAYRVESSGGETSAPTAASGATGTEVEVRNLFYHTPARLKFMRSAKQEGRDIISLIERLIVANPNVSFCLVVDGKQVLRTVGAGLAEAARVVFGDEAFDHMLPIEHTEYGYTIKGYISDTDYSAGTRASQITVLNGRVVNNLNLSASINNAYRDFLMKRNYALFALHITMPTDEVDVNVHPTKADVRFVYASKIIGLAYRVVRAALEEHLKSRDIVFDSIAVSAGETKPSPHTAAEHIELSAAAKRATEFAEPQDFFEQYRRSIPSGIFEVNPRAKDLPTDDSTRNIDDIPQVMHNAAETIADASPYQSAPSGENSTDDTINADNFDSTALRVVGQLFGTYIVAEYAGQVLLIDQHAAAERVLYNDLMRQYATQSLVIQPMLVPYTFRLAEEESASLALRLQPIRALGIEIEQIGDTQFALYSVPALLTDMDVEQFIHLLLSDGFDGQSADVLHDRLAYAACRAAIKGNTYMDNDALQILCSSLFSTSLPGQCPHGRPAYITVTKRQLEKMFKRIV